MLPFLRGVNDVLNAQKVREVPEWLCMDMNKSAMRRLLNLLFYSFGDENVC
ncbi:hypothetical protein IFVP182_C260361 [Vibrio parahaemolyticus]